MCKSPCVFLLAGSIVCELISMIQPEFLQGFQMSPIMFPRANSSEAWSPGHFERTDIKKSIVRSDPGDGITPELQDTGLHFGC